MAIPTVVLDLPEVGGDSGVWGSGLNAALSAIVAGTNALISLANAQGTSGFVFWNGSAWPTTLDPTVPYVFISVGDAAAPTPTGGADNSVWIGQS